MKTITSLLGKISMLAISSSLAMAQNTIEVGTTYQRAQPANSTVAYQITPSPEITVKYGNRNLVDRRSKINFGTRKTGKKGKARTFTITNSGTSDLTITKIYLSGKNRRDFVLRNKGKRKVAPGATTKFKVAFNPRKRGKCIASVKIKSNDLNGNLFKIGLTGKGKKINSGSTNNLKLNFISRIRTLDGYIMGHPIFIWKTIENHTWSTGFQIDTIGTGVSMNLTTGGSHFGTLRIKRKKGKEYEVAVDYYDGYTATALSPIGGGEIQGPVTYDPNNNDYAIYIKVTLTKN